MAIENLFEPENMDWLWEATILGEPASKSNRRQIVKIGGKTRLIKSNKALAYAREFHLQAPRMPLRQPILEDVVMWCRIHYDRQIKAKVVLWALDRENPRSEIKLACLS